MCFTDMFTPNVTHENIGEEVEHQTFSVKSCPKSLKKYTSELMHFKTTILKTGHTNIT